MTSTVTTALSNFAANLRFEDLPIEVVEETKRLLLDTIGCGLGGHHVEKGQIAVKYADSMGGIAEATVIGTREKRPAAIAAFANGDLMNALDWNVLMPPSHVPPYVIPPALALAERDKKSGRDLITALVVAMEVAGRVGTSLGGLRATKGGFPRRVWGISANQIGATAGAAHSLGLDTDTMQHALGLAAFHAPLPSHVKYNYTQNVGYAKFAPSGWIAQAGVTTASLAQMGYRGDTEFLEGDYGFAAMNGVFDWHPEKITDRLMEHWVFTNAAYKFWPTCGFYQSPLDLFTAMIDEHNLRPEDIEEVIYYIEEFASIPKYTTTAPKDHVEAAASGPFVFAVAAHRIQRGPKWQEKSLLTDPSIQSFMKKVRHETNPDSETFRHLDIEVEGRPYLRHRPARVTIKTHDHFYDRSTKFANWLSIGQASCAPSNNALADKFRLNAEDILKKDSLNAAIDLLQDLENIDDITKLLAVLTPK